MTGVTMTNAVVGMRNGLPQVAVKKVKKERPPLDREHMGFGKHAWDHIDPESVPTDFGPPGGVARRDFNGAFNKPHPETDVTIDTLSRLGAVVSTTAPGFEGDWVVVRIPQYKDNRVWAHLKRVGDEAAPTTLVPIDELGVSAEKYTNLYAEAVVTKLLSGGKANKSTREALTKKSEEVYE